MSCIIWLNDSLDFGSARRASDSCACSLATRSRKESLSIDGVLKKIACARVYAVLLCHSLRRQAGDFDVAGAGRGDSLVDCAIGLSQEFVGAVRWIDDHQAAAGEPDPGIVRMNGKVGDEHFRDPERCEPLMHHAAL